LGVGSSHQVQNLDDKFWDEVPGDFIVAKVPVLSRPPIGFGSDVVPMNHFPQFLSSNDVANLKRARSDIKIRSVNLRSPQPSNTKFSYSPSCMPVIYPEKGSDTGLHVLNSFCSGILN